MVADLDPHSSYLSAEEYDEILNNSSEIVDTQQN